MKLTLKDTETQENVEVGMFIQVLCVNRRTGEIIVQTDCEKFIHCSQQIKKMKEEVDATHQRQIQRPL